MARIKNKLSHSGCSGERGLLVAVITQAVNDATGRNDEHKATAEQFFMSEQYRNYLTWLGLPVDWQPEVLGL